jgi:hypothetical protein
MESHVPYVGLALGFWIVFVAVFAAIVRRALFAFLLGVLFTAVFVGYCAYYQGIPAMGGIIHALSGGLYSILVFHFFGWLRSRSHRRTSKPEPPNPTLQRTPDSASVSKSDASGPAPLRVER